MSDKSPDYRHAHLLAAQEQQVPSGLSKEAISGLQYQGNQSPAEFKSSPFRQSTALRNENIAAYNTSVVTAQFLSDLSSLRRERLWIFKDFLSVRVTFAAYLSGEKDMLSALVIVLQHGATTEKGVRMK